MCGFSAVIVIVGIVAYMVYLGIETARRAACVVKACEILRYAGRNGDLAQTAVANLRRALAELGPRTEAENAQLLGDYRGIIAGAVADGRVDRGELRLLQQVESILALSQASIDRGRTQGYLIVLADAVKDGDFTVEEDNRLRALRQTLAVPASLVSGHDALLLQLRKARVMRTAELAPIKNIPSGRSEEPCYFSSPAVMTAERVVRSYQHMGQRISERGWVDQKEGELCITDRRILFVGGGTTTIKVSHVLDCVVEPEHGHLSITSSQRKIAIHLRTAEPYVAAALVNRLRNP